MRALTALFITMLSACGASNDELIKQHNQCLDAGMDEAVYLSGLSMVPTRIICVPKKDGGSNG